MKKRITIILVGVLFIIMCSGCTQIDTKWLQENAGKGLMGAFKQGNIEDTQSAGNGQLNEASANGSQMSDMRYTTLYYQSDDGLLIPITRRAGRVEGIAKAALSALVDIPVVREDIDGVGLYPVLPADTQINGLTIKDGIARVDFSEQILNYESVKNGKNVLGAVVYTLTEFENIHSVQILVNGKEMDGSKFGYKNQSPFGRNGINMDGDWLGNNPIEEQSNKEQVEVYFTKSINDKVMYLVPISRTINKPSDDIDRYKMMLNELIKGDVGNRALKSYVPSKLGVKGIQFEGQIVILDFNDEMVNAVASNTNYENMMRQILACFRQFGKVKGIKIHVNGNPLSLPGKDAGKDILEVPQYINIF